MFLLREWHSAKLIYLLSALKAILLFISPFMNLSLHQSHRIAAALCLLNPPRYNGEPQRNFPSMQKASTKWRVLVNSHSAEKSAFERCRDFMVNSVQR